MSLGLSFGANTTKINQQTTADQTSVSNQTGTTATNQTQTGATSTTGSQTGTTSGSTKGTTASTQSNTATGQQQQSGTTTNFSDAVLKALESSGLGDLASLQSSGAVDTSKLNTFDPNAYVSGETQRAQSAADEALKVGQGGLFDSLGGTANGNTMAALLNQKLLAQNASSVNGATADATAQANEIVRQNIATQQAGRGQEASITDAILAALKGGTTTSDTTGTTAESSDQQNQGVSSQLSDQIQQLLSSSNTQSISDLVGLVSQLVSNTTNTSGTQNVSGTTSQKGGGIGLGI